MINNYNPVTNGGGNLPPYFDVILGAKKAKGSIASFESFLESFPIAGIKVNIEPVQEGSGDPSPENIRPITGWTSCNIYHSGEDTSNPTVIPITFPSEAGTVYGGKLEINEDGSGILTVNRISVSLGGRNWGVGSASNSTLFCSLSGINRDAKMLCDVYSYYGKVSVSGQVSRNNSIYSFSGYSGIGVRDDRFDVSTQEGIDDFKDYLADKVACVAVSSPRKYEITSAQVKTLLGTNNIWADTGDVEVTYGDYLNIINSRLSALESNS